MSEKGEKEWHVRRAHTDPRITQDHLSTSTTHISRCITFVRLGPPELTAPCNTRALKPVRVIQNGAPYEY